MDTNSFEEAFANFINRREYDEAEAALFSMVRISFKAGWEAVGDDSPKPHPTIELLPKTPNN